MTKKKRLFLKGMKLNLWEIGIFKISTLSIGMLFALYFAEFISPFTALLWLVAIASTGYMIYLYFKQ